MIGEFSKMQLLAASESKAETLPCAVSQDTKICSSQLFAFTRAELFHITELWALFVRLLGEFAIPLIGESSVAGRHCRVCVFNHNQSAPGVLQLPREPISVLRMMQNYSDAAT